MSAKSGSLSCPLYKVAGCPLFWGCLSIEVNGRTVGTFRIVCYIMGVRFSGVFTFQGCPLIKWGSTVCMFMMSAVGAVSPTLVITVCEISYIYTSIHI